MHYASFRDASEVLSNPVWNHFLVYRKNPEREAILLGCWYEGLAGRKAAIATGIPEGSVSRYYARFNKNPEKYHRQAKEVRQDRRDPLGKTVRRMNVVSQVVEFEGVQKRFTELMEQDKFVEAKALLDAFGAFQKFRSNMVQAVAP